MVSDKSFAITESSTWLGHTYQDDTVINRGHHNINVPEHRNSYFRVHTSHDRDVFTIKATVVRKLGLYIETRLGLLVFYQVFTIWNAMSVFKTDLPSTTAYIVCWTLSKLLQHTTHYELLLSNKFDLYIYILLYWRVKYIYTIECRFNAFQHISRYCMNNYRNSGRISTRRWFHKRHPIPRPDGRATGCLLWIFVRKLTAL